MSGIPIVQSIGTLINVNLWFGSLVALKVSVSTSSCDPLFTLPFCEACFLEVDVVGTSDETLIIVSLKGCVSYRGSGHSKYCRCP